MSKLHTTKGQFICVLMRGFSAPLDAVPQMSWYSDDTTRVSVTASVIELPKMGLPRDSLHARMLRVLRGQISMSGNVKDEGQLCTKHKGQFQGFQRPKDFNHNPMSSCGSAI